MTQAIKPANPERAAVPMTWQRTQVMTRFLDESISLNPLPMAALHGSLSCLCPQNFALNTRT